MPKQPFEDDDDDIDVSIKINNEYAKQYDQWRKKEELNKLKTKYGEGFTISDEESDSSSEDDELGEELTADVEKQFFKTLSCLKSKDPRIYDENTKFFEENDNENSGASKKRAKKDQPLYLKDYERKILLEKGGKLSDSDDDENNIPRSSMDIKEHKKLKKEFAKAAKNIEEDEEESDSDGFLKVRKEPVKQTQTIEEDYKKWLTGKEEHTDDKNTEKELKPLKDFWTNPRLDEGEKFLRDYILNKGYLENENDDYIPTYDQIVHESDDDLSRDDEELEKQEEFEHKYNYRFEEPDQEFIKRYPRTMEHSLRKKDDKRKLKRAEIKERKEKEKQQKKEELKKLQELKRKEIEEKIQQLKEITGNTEIGFNDEDVEGDFDPEAHDRRMQALFNDEFYQGSEEEQKPRFTDIDEELELENWDGWHGDEQQAEKEGREELHCEDDEFNMDCDYDPTSTQKELIENSKRKKKRGRKSKFAQLISQPKPVFDPNDKTYEEYLDEYYKFDCEDIIGDIPCRFKYRKVVPNSFGLSVEEILLAKDRELNKWCSLKKAVQHRPEHVEKYDQVAYEKKAKNEALKKRILPSLYEPESENTTETNTLNKTGENSKESNKNSTKTENSNKEKAEVAEETENKPKKKKNKNKSTKNETSNALDNLQDKTSLELSDSNKSTKKKKKRNKNKNNETINLQNGDTVSNLQNPEPLNKKTKLGEQDSKTFTDLQNNLATETNNFSSSKKNKKRKHNQEENATTPAKKFKKDKKFSKKNQNKKAADIDIGISDARLKAFGFNAKKFKNKLKYGNKNK